MRRHRCRLFVLMAAVMAAVVTGPFPATATAGRVPDTVAAAALADTHLSPATGERDFVRAVGSSLLAVDGGRGTPEVRALRYLATHGSTIGMTGAERAMAAARVRGVNAPVAASELRPLRVVRNAGRTHVRLEQLYQGLPVFGGHVVVHLDARGVSAVNGTFVPGISVDPAATVPEAEARTIALDAISKTQEEPSALATDGAALTIYRTGLTAGVPGANRLAWQVEVIGDEDEERVWVDAHNGALLDRIETTHGAKDRCVYTPTYEPTQPELFAVRREGQPATNVPPVDNLYEFSGHVYDLFNNTFGFDGHDGQGSKMRTIYNADASCPNAFYRSRTQSTYFCPGFDIDDVVAHEWAHGYTEHTSGLIYAWQSGALNESYSDIWGEIIDLLNGVDGIAGANNAEPWPAGERWMVGEDLTDPVHGALLLRDMWDPERLGLPAKVSSAKYFCGAGDGGGVHYNSSVPNHAFAMLVDGKTYNGETVDAIGMTKAAHIHWGAQLAYLTPSTNFAGHAHALLASCNDLRSAGANLRSLMTGAPAGEVVSSADCAEVEGAIAATEMLAAPEQCGFGPLLAKAAPPVCGGASTMFSENFEDGLAGWSATSTGSDPANWGGHQWAAASSLPSGRAGTAAFAVDPRGGSCDPTRFQDESGVFTLESPPIELPSVSNGPLRLRFDHYVETEALYDGGNVKISVNGGAFAPVPATAYTYNAPNLPLTTASRNLTGDGANPLAGQAAWTGADGGSVLGSWGTTVADLTGVAAPGDQVRLRFDFGIDCSGGATGWFVDDVRIYSCPPLPAPAVALGNDYSEPDADGSYTIGWQRPAGATGPDELQEAVVTAPLIADDAESGLGNWVLSATSPAALAWTTSRDKPNHDSTAFYAPASEASMSVIEYQSMMTWKDAIAIPAQGQTLLQFREWNMNEPDDGVFVDVSEDGVQWRTVFAGVRSDTLRLMLESYSTEPLTPRAVDLTAFAGSSVHLRFRFQIGYTNYVQRTPFGWYVDDVEIRNVDWQPLLTTAGTSHIVTGRPPGSYLYRVRTAYTFDAAVVPGDWSEAVRAVVA